MNSEAILDSLIESGHIYLGKIDSDVVYDAKTACILCIRHQLDFIDHPGSFLVIQRALFNECAKRDIRVEIVKNKLDLRQGYALIFRADTSRESFALAYQKVVEIV